MKAAASLFAILLMFPSFVTAQNIGQEPVNFNENLRDEAEISGALFAGLQRADGRPSAVDTAIYVEVPEHWAGGMACLRVTTANGLYDSTAEYPIQAGATVVPLRFPTEHADYLSNRPEGGVAALMTRGNCADRSSESAVVRWDEAAEEPATIFLNAFRADRVYVYLGSDPIPIECVPLVDEGRTAYDMRCNLGILPIGGPINLEILSVTNGQSSDPASLTLMPMMTR